MDQEVHQDEMIRVFLWLSYAFSNIKGGGGFRVSTGSGFQRSHSGEANSPGLVNCFRAISRRRCSGHWCPPPSVHYSMAIQEEELSGWQMIPPAWTPHYPEGS